MIKTTNIGCGGCKGDLGCSADKRAPDPWIVPVFVCITQTERFYCSRLHQDEISVRTQNSRPFSILQAKVYVLCDVRTSNTKIFPDLRTGSSFLTV